MKITELASPLTTILALDLGTTTGWALRAPGTPITHGVISFKTQRFEGGGMRFLRFKRWLTDIKQCNDGIDQLHHALGFGLIQLLDRKSVV